MSQGGPAGVLERSWSRNLTNAVFRPTPACATVRDGAPAALRKAASATARGVIGHLVSTQGQDGGWGHWRGDRSDPISTAYAVIALSRDPQQADAFDRALRYLIRRQRPDGGYVSRPDQVGPRPFSYDVPALGDVCVLLALAHAASATGTRGPSPAADSRTL